MKMKNLIIILLVITGLSVLISCEKETKDPVLDMTLTVKPAITLPSNGAALVLIKEEADNTLMTTEWTATQYNLTDLEATKYVLQMDLAGSNFENAIDLVTTEGTSVSTTVGQMNNTLLSLSNSAMAGSC